MTTIQFYHLTATPMDRALPKLLEKAVAGGFKTLLLADSDERVEHLDQLLWTYDPGSFLPHGTTKGAHPEKQPVLLSTRMDPVNEAKLLLITNGSQAEQPERFERIFDMFDGKDEQAVKSARVRWSSYKDAGFEMAYLRQNDEGGWEKKNT